MSPVAFAVVWTLSLDFVGSTLISGTRPEQLGEHLAAAEAQIPADALSAFDRIAKEIRYPFEG